MPVPGLILPPGLIGKKESSIGSGPLSVVGSNTSTSSSISLPSAAQAGDVIFLASGANALRSNTPPDGFTTLRHTQSSDGHTCLTSWAIAEGGETEIEIPGSYNRSCVILIRAYAIGLEPGTSTYYAGPNDPDRNLDASGGVAPCIVWGAWFYGSTVNSPSAAWNSNPAYDHRTDTAGNPSSSYSCRAMVKIYNSGTPPNPFQVTGFDAGNNNFIHCGVCNVIQGG